MHKVHQIQGSSTWHLVSVCWLERICYACLLPEYFVLIALKRLQARADDTLMTLSDKTA